jgi:hypothetical protein
VLLGVKACECYASMESEILDHMGPLTLHEQLQFAHTPQGLGDNNQRAFASRCDGEGCSSSLCPGVASPSELNRLPLPWKTKSGPDDYGVAARTSLNAQYLGTMPRHMFELPIKNILDILQCKLRIVPHTFRWTVTRNIDAEKLEHVRHYIP